MKVIKSEINKSLYIIFVKKFATKIFVNISIYPIYDMNLKLFDEIDTFFIIDTLQLHSNKPSIEFIRTLVFQKVSK